MSPKQIAKEPMRTREDEIPARPGVLSRCDEMKGRLVEANNAWDMDGIWQASEVKGDEDTAASRLLNVSTKYIES